VIKNIIFDFDGVILDSIPVKTEAFRKLFNDFPSEKVEMLVSFHLKNGGMSRYKKIEYFFMHIMNEQIEDTTILEYARKYSKITKEELAQPKYLILDSLEFIRQNYKKYNMHIASGADEEDLKYICKKLEIDKYFLSINGSPTVKSKIVRFLLQKNNYREEETILIGDSINDADAADENQIDFYGYNNTFLKDKYKYIPSLTKSEF